MNKQKQIEEMAQCKNFNGYTCSSCGVKLACDRYILAEELYNAGYRKIPKDNVVLTREEYDEYEKCKDLLKQYIDGELINEDTFALQVEELKLLRKEMVEKFAERVKMAFYYHFDELIPSIMADKIDEICKEITEGK